MLNTEAITHNINTIANFGPGQGKIKLPRTNFKAIAPRHLAQECSRLVTLLNRYRTTYSKI